MILTEAEAKTKWCPFTYAVQELRGPDYNGIREGGPWHCCTTHCMAWQVAETREFAARAEAEFRKSGKRLTADTGYCAMLRTISTGQRDG